MMAQCIVFYGADSQTGTTMMALAAGELLARQGNRVLYIDASGNTGNVFLPGNPPGSLDDLRPVLRNELPGPEEIRGVISVCRGMDVIPGLKHDSGWMDFKEEDVGRICRGAGSQYTHILVDGGSGRPAGIRHSALRAADRTVLVVTQQEKTLQRLEGWMTGWPRSTILAVNQFSTSGVFYSAEELAKRLRWEGHIVKIPHVPYGWQAELEGTTLLRFRKYRKSAEKLVKIILEGGSHDAELTDAEHAEYTDTGAAI